MPDDLLLDLNAQGFLGIGPRFVPFVHDVVEGLVAVEGMLDDGLNLGVAAGIQGQLGFTVQLVQQRLLAFQPSL